MIRVMLRKIPLTAIWRMDQDRESLMMGNKLSVDLTAQNTKSLRQNDNNSSKKEEMVIDRYRHMCVYNTHTQAHFAECYQLNVCLPLKFVCWSPNL